MTNEKQPGKKSKFQLPQPVTWPIRVLDRYDKFFREKLRQAISDDFAKFPEGGPTYHQQVFDIVSDYAGEIVDPSQLDERDLRNFLKGKNSRTIRIAILDAYIQIVNPGIRKTFFVNSYVENVGSTFSEYLGSPGFTAAERKEVIAGMVGVWEIKNEHRLRRFLVVRRSHSERFLLCYEFSYSLQEQEDTDRDEPMDLRSGICVPSPMDCFIIMRNYNRDQRFVGKFRPTDIDTRPSIGVNPFNGNGVMVTISANETLSIRAVELERQDLISEYRSTNLNLLRKIDTESVIDKLQKQVSAFGNVI